MDCTKTFGNKLIAVSKALWLSLARDVMYKCANDIQCQQQIRQMVLEPQYSYHSPPAYDSIHSKLITYLNT